MKLFDIMCQLGYADVRYPGLFHVLVVKKLKDKYMYGNYIVFVREPTLKLYKDGNNNVTDFDYTAYNVVVPVPYNVYDFDNANIRVLGSNTILRSKNTYQSLREEFDYWINQI